MTSQRLLSDMNLAVAWTDASIQVDLVKEMSGQLRSSVLYKKNKRRGQHLVCLQGHNATFYIMSIKLI